MDRYGRRCDAFKALLYGGPRDGTVVPLDGPQRELRVAVNRSAMKATWGKGTRDEDQLSTIEVHRYGIAGRVPSGEHRGHLAFEWRPDDLPRR